MIIKGLVKSTLIDYPGKIACIVFTGGCNLKCKYCHNKDLVLHPNKFVSMRYVRTRHQERGVGTFSA